MDPNENPHQINQSTSTPEPAPLLETAPKRHQAAQSAGEVSPEQRNLMIDLHDKGYGTRRIAPRVGRSRKVVQRILRQEGRLSDQPTQPPARKLDPYRASIEHKVSKGLTTSRILREIKQEGYQGARTQLAEYVRELRSRITPEANKKAVTRRFETRPGEEMQIDWSPYIVPIAGIMVVVHALGVLLCHSRKLFLHFFRDERQSSLLEGLAMAFEYFAGCALRLVLDNMATAVLGRYAVNGKPIWNERFLDFVRHYGPTPVACWPRQPNRKGKKEKSFRLVEDDFLKGSSFLSMQELNHRARIWLDHTPEAANLRVHGTTRRVPNEAYLSERDFLIQLPDKRFPVYEQETRLVDQDSTISVRGTRYTVPSHLANRPVAVRLFAEHYEVLDRNQRIAFSRRYVEDEDKGTLIIDPTHYATSPRRTHRGDQRLDQAFLKRFPDLAPLVTGLQSKMKSLAPVHFRALLRLAEQYGEEAFRTAATRAQEYRRYSAQAVGRILERDHGPANDPPVAPLGGLGAVIVGDLDPGSLDAYAHLDSLDRDDDHDADGDERTGEED